MERNAIGGTLVSSEAALAPRPAVGQTMVVGASQSPSSLHFDATVLQSDVPTSGPAVVVAKSASSHTLARSAVLPRASQQGPVEPLWPVDDRPRYEQLAALGEGGMGEVALVQDHDIGRKVAVKRLRPEQRTSTGLLRFTDEVRIIGQLEHPAIVPIHDVGVDEEGRHYLVMKYVEGETLETVIEKLKAGEPSHVARYTFNYRAQVFLSVLAAMRYAHARGVVHRDIKPSNIMVGPFGEVTVMDWGLAKRVRAEGDAASSVEIGPASAVGSVDPARLHKTQLGAVMGTPLYMSPEQARGQNESIDERSDVYSLSLLFYELLTLTNPLADKTSIEALLAFLASDQEFDAAQLFDTATRANVPAEFIHFVRPGLRKDRRQRYASVAEMEEMLRRTLAGDIKAQCAVTMTKRSMHRFMGWIDRNTKAFVTCAMATVGLLVVGLIAAVVTLVIKAI